MPIKEATRSKEAKKRLLKRRVRRTIRTEADIAARAEKARKTYDPKARYEGIGPPSQTKRGKKKQAERMKKKKKK